MKQFIYFGLCLLLAASCRPVKKVQNIEEAISKKDSIPPVVVKATENPVDSFVIARNIIDAITDKRIDFKTFSAKLKIDYQGRDASDHATAYIRIKKDSLIWISLTGALGIEGFRLLINKDSVRMMNKLDKTIQDRAITYLQELTEVPLDFYSLQDVIIGNPVFIDHNIISYTSNDNEMLILMVGNVFKHLISLEKKDYRVTHSKLDDIDDMRTRTCDITYEGYENVGGLSFSTKRRITVAEKSKFDVDVEFKNYVFNIQQDYPFNPKNYKRK